MYVKDIISLSTRNFKTRTMRTFLTILGVGVGIGTIVFLVSLGYGLQRILLERITTSESLLSLDVASPEGGVILLNKEILEKLMRIPEVKEVSPSVDVTGQIELNEVSADITAEAYDASFLRLSGLRPFAGSLPEKQDITGVLLSKATLALLGVKEPKDAIGKKVKLTLFIPKNAQSQEVDIVNPKYMYTVTGVTDEEIIPLALVRMDSVNAEFPFYSLAKVKVSTSEQLEIVRNTILEMGFSVSALSDTIDQANKIFNAFQIILAVFGIIALIVSAIGMFNTMTVALLERTQEIGIMKAIGASNKNIALLFLLESGVMGFLGGIGGVFIGYGIGEVFNLGINILARTLGGQSLSLFVRPSWFILTVIIFSGFVGFITGVFPARRATKLNPLSALRYK